MPSPTPHEQLAGAVRKQWARLLLHNVHFANGHRRLDALYRIRDPWELESEAQQFRFRETNRLIHEQFGGVGTILEVGCGEGHQSEELLKIGAQLVGIDVSARAVERARQRCPEATFLTYDLADPALAREARFDLALACEVLYYVKDVAAALRRLNELGKACLVTYYSRPSETLDQFVLETPGVTSVKLEYEASTWTAAWWRADAGTAERVASAN